MGGGGPSSSGGGGGYSKAWTEPITYEKLLPSWTMSGQKQFLPQLLSRAEQGGLTKEEQDLLWGMARSEVQQGATAAGKALGGKMAGAGISPTSPVWAGEAADIAASVPTGVASAVANLAKLKIGAGETSREQLLKALYTPPPYTTGHFGESSQWSSQSSSGGSGGGGK